MAVKRFRGTFENGKVLEIYSLKVEDAIVLIKAASITHWDSPLVEVEDTYRHKKYKPTLIVSYEEL